MDLLERVQLMFFVIGSYVGVVWVLRRIIAWGVLTLDLEDRIMSVVMGVPVTAAALFLLYLAAQALHWVAFGAGF